MYDIKRMATELSSDKNDSEPTKFMHTLEYIRTFLNEYDCKAIIEILCL